MLTGPHRPQAVFLCAFPWRHGFMDQDDFSWMIPCFIEECLHACPQSQAARPETRSIDDLLHSSIFLAHRIRHVTARLMSKRVQISQALGLKQVSHILHSSKNLDGNNDSWAPD